MNSPKCTDVDTYSPTKPFLNIWQCGITAKQAFIVEICLKYHTLGKHQLEKQEVKNGNIERKKLNGLFLKIAIIVNKSKLFLKSIP